MSSIVITRIFLLMIAIVWLTFWSAQAGAQRLDEWQRMRTQIDDLDKRQQEFAIDIQTRMVKVETNLETISKVVWGIAAAVGLHLVQALAGLLLTNRSPRGNPGP